MGGGRLRRPPLIKLSILYEEDSKIYTKTHKHMQIHISTCKNVKNIKNVNICENSDTLIILMQFQNHVEIIIKIMLLFQGGFKTALN